MPYVICCEYITGYTSYPPEAQTSATNPIVTPPNHTVGGTPSAIMKCHLWHRFSTLLKRRIHFEDGCIMDPRVQYLPPLSLQNE
jgi:hypothetical protein